MTSDDITVRRVCAGDATGLEAFYADLSEDSRVARFHAACRGITRRRAERDAAVDHRHRDGFVAVQDGRVVGHLMLEPTGAGVEELAVAVADDVQHRGVGSLLMAAAVASARQRGVRRLMAWIRPENEPMRRLFMATHHPAALTGWDGLHARYEFDVPPWPAAMTVTAAGG